MISRSQLHGGFPIKQLGEVVEFLDHKRRPITAKDRIDGPFPYYGANGQQDSVADYLFDEPLILVAEDGGHFDNPDRGIAYRVAGKTWVNNHAHVLRPKPCVDLAFLCRVLENYDIRPYISGTTRAKLTKGQAEKIEVPLPPLAEQRRIAAILDQADAVRRKRQEAIDMCDRAIQALFSARFKHLITGDGGVYDQPLSSLLREPMRSGAYFAKEHYVTEGGVPMVHMGDVFGGIVNLTGLKRVSIPNSDQNKYTLLRDDLLIARRSINYEGAAKPCMIPTNEALIFESSLIRLRPNPLLIDHVYLFHFLANPTVRAQRIVPLVTRSTISGINQANLGSVKVALPSMKEQSEFRNEVEALEAVIQKNNVAAAMHESLFASLQSRAFRGEL